ncbi:PQQ-dependent dehydrogenase, methanol/ethanol family [Bradyrhizobium sp. 23]|uniref:PQQ-dependent dehydrogenase, methanol/ethanol family n=1 Tax=Bradyrhizobium sp. 23 TaxID=2782667 RepID=UPI001FFBA2D9|nr:PQQ-dependent dehydrogenase, methanol/ethanol family [Bradyrhizobium sp. 23]MCK1315467.1 PQQ-dependent dehydrogenase, methanol/ethanol family [Bradyrhizobium sp. 23]
MVRLRQVTQRSRLLKSAILCAFLGFSCLLPSGDLSAQAASEQPVGVTVRPVDAARMSNAAQEPGSWLNVGGTYAETHYSPLDQVNASNIQRLKLAWSGEFDTSRGQEATPLMIDGVLYTSTAWSKVYAYDASSGREIWRFDPKVPGKSGVNACCDVVNRGVAAWNGKIYVGTLDGRLVALDSKTGRQVWSTMTVDVDRPYTITGAPRAVKGKILIGNGGAELGVRGYVSAYDSETGELAWRFYITPNPTNSPDGAASDDVLREKAFGTWGDGIWKKTGGGGTAWDAIVYDQDFDQVLIGTGNGSPWNHRVRSGPGMGDNLFLSSIVAVDPQTGRYKWHYQETPAEEWDFTATQPIILSELSIHGQPRKVLMHAPKNGFFYVIDRQNGKLISARNFTPVNWAAGIDLKTGRPIEYPEARYSTNGGDFLAKPAAYGSHNWHPMSYSPKTGLVYIPAQEAPLGYADQKDFVYKPGPGFWNIADGSTQPVNLGPLNETHRQALKAMTQGELIAWDPVKEQEVWRVQHPSIGAGGVLSTGGGLVFQGTPDGLFHAYLADTGKEVWSFDGNIGIIAGAMSYAVGSEQYIAIVTGFGGAGGLHVPYIDVAKSGTGRVLVFKLDGSATLPPAKLYEKAEALVPTDSWPADVVAKGAALYGNCLFCHGFSAISNGVVPDLRRSRMVNSKDGWKAVVIDGALEAKGMISFADRLSEADAEAIRAYIADRAKQLASDEAVRKRASQ